MITTLVARQGKPIPEVIQQEIGKLSKEHTKILADAHKKELDKSIEDTRERVMKPVGDHLKDQIQVEEIAESGFSGVINSGYGVGNISILNLKAKWWRWLNYGIAGTGRRIPPGTKENPRITGHFVPGTKGIFTKGQPKFPIDPKKAIKPHNYIEKALGVMISKVKELLK
jgi:hypothetical protein